MKPKKLVILGSTGSIGENTARVVRNFPGCFEVVGLAARASAEKLGKQAAEFNCPRVVIGGEALVAQVRKYAPDCRVDVGDEALIDLVTHPEVDIVLCSIIGTGGLLPVLKALELGKTVALASKEVLVMAGELVMKTAREYGGRIIPVDSEHSAIFQCLADRHQSSEIRRLILTASGGAFRDLPTAELENMTFEAALNHPAWRMGPKITVDSATMMNKVLEVIEASFLYNVPEDRIEVLIHPEAVVHSLVEFVDNSILAQLSEPDMCLPIQYALFHPERRQGKLKPLNLAAYGQLNFRAPDPNRYPALELAYHALREGGTMPAVLNAANEEAVEFFRKRQIRFTDIPKLIEVVMRKVPCRPAPDLPAILAADREARAAAGEYLKIL
jgi:1-deoxy-D-xylulose-5-phosphate reductoisomerase